MHPYRNGSPVSLPSPSLSPSFTTSTVHQEAPAPPTPLCWALCMGMWGHRLPSASFPAWCGVWGPATSWRRSCLPPVSPPSMNWDPTTWAASRPSIYPVSGRLGFNFQCGAQQKPLPSLLVALADHLLCFSLSILYNIFSSFCHYIPFPHTFLSICIPFFFFTFYLPHVTLLSQVKTRKRR